MIEHKTMMDLGLDWIDGGYELKPRGHWRYGLLRHRKDYNIRLRLQAQSSGWTAELSTSGQASMLYRADGQTVSGTLSMLLYWMNLEGDKGDVAMQCGLELLKSAVSGLRMDLEMAVEKQPAADVETLDGMREKRYLIRGLAGPRIPVRIVGWRKESLAPGVCRTFLRLEPEHTDAVGLEVEFPFLQLEEIPEEA